MGNYESRGIHFLIRAPGESEVQLPESVSIFQHKTLVAVMSKSCIFIQCQSSCIKSAQLVQCIDQISNSFCKMVSAVDQAKRALARRLVWFADVEKRC